MKQPDEIKKGLEVCKRHHCDKGCTFGGEKLCYVTLHKDALAYIQQLERENASLDKAVRDAAELMVSGTELMSKRIIELEMERDATLKKLKAYEWYEGESDT